jgi:predicted nucleotidyltransferase component of viral defense system
MKSYHEQHIRAAEILQLILLQHIYAQSGSQNLVFQGGTALRWCYGGGRFSEDLDFVFSCPLATLDAVLAKALKGAEREMVPHFGPGRLLTSDKSSRSGAHKLMATWHPETGRQRIAVKLEFEPLAAGITLDTSPLVLSYLPAVAYLIAAGEFRIPHPNSVLVAETAQEILSDKVRALLERSYLKGRDLYDVWYLTAMLNTAVGRDLVERKFRAYHWPFVAARQLEYFIEPDAVAHDAIATAIRQDLERFLPAAVMAVHAADGYSAFFKAAHDLCAGLRRSGVAA